MIALGCVVVMGGCSWECEPGQTKYCIPSDGSLCGYGEATCLQNRTWDTCRCAGPPWDISEDPDAPSDTASDPEDVPTDLPLDEETDPAPDLEDATDIPPDPGSDEEDVEDEG